MLIRIYYGIPRRARGDRRGIIRDNNAVILAGMTVSSYREVSEYMAWQIPSMALDSGILAGMTA